jgi:uncharacterized protein (TIGR00159 family)
MDAILSFLQNVRWQDFFDIVLNSYILFRLYVLFRGTNVFRVLIGIAFLWFFQRVAVYLGLIVTSWVMQGIIAVAALIIIVVFRNEIRSVLQAKNLRALLWGIPQRGGETPVDIIVESVYDLARKHTGALIVLPGREDLKDLIHSGVAWEGVVSQEMIKSIFWPDNPVHDGAAIIEGDRVVEVGAILPISYRQDLPSHYGTRHRAAVGLTENTDALVVVVSEERGQITVAKGSKMRGIRSKETLTQMISEHVGVATRQWGYRRREQLELAAAAVVSILFIAGVWISFTQGMDTLVDFDVPVEYMNRDPSMEIVQASVNRVELHLGGSGSLIRSMRPDQVKVRLDLSQATIGTNTFTLTNEDIGLPPGVRLRGVEPRVVEVTLDKTIEKELPVQVDWTGKLPSQLMLTRAEVEPEKIKVVGGQQILKEIDTIYTENVLLDKIEQSGEITVPVVLNPASLKVAPGSTDEVKITYRVETRKG